MKIRQVLLLSLVLTLVAGCKKDDGITVIDGNTAPPDPTISNIVKESYVNKAYIGLLGREPEAAERTAALTILSKNDLSVENRKEMLDQIQAKDAYHVRIHEIAFVDLLDALDTVEITNNIIIYNFLLTDSSYANIWDVILDEIDRMELLRDIPVDLAAGTIGIREVHRRCVNNQFYDEINMGTENFVVSMFQNFLFRYPTLSELDESSQMIDGLGGTLFLQIGVTKPEFLDIFLNSSEYYEGQVRDLYLRYLFREPTSQEMAEHSAAYEASDNYQELQKNILSLDEYVGL